MFKNESRNNNLRGDILKSYLSNLMTDDERADLWNLPDGCRMREGSKIITRENFECGEYVWIGEGSILDASGGLSVGAHTSIGVNCMIWSHSSVLTNLTMNNKSGSDLIARAKTTIGAGCFIGGPSVIFPGITIGDRTVLLPMSVVTKNLPGNCIAGGNPARVIQLIDEKYIEDQIQRFKDKGQL